MTSVQKYSFQNFSKTRPLHPYLQVPIVNNTVCDAAYQRNNINETAMLCAGYAEGGIDACQVIWANFIFFG